MRQWLYKTDEGGRPRRFLEHRELLLWVALKVGRFAGPPLGLLLLAGIFDLRGLGHQGFVLFGLMVLALCAVAVAVMYV